jgi:hypothetical protein
LNSNVHAPRGVANIANPEERVAPQGRLHRNGLSPALLCVRVISDCRFRKSC